MKAFKWMLLISAGWIVVPGLYLYVFFPIMNTIQDALNELALVVNIAFLGTASTLIVWAAFRLVHHYNNSRS